MRADADRPKCIDIARCHLGIADWDWSFAKEHAAAIEQDWQRRRAAIPSLFNGSIYLLRDHVVGPDHLTGTVFKSDFKSYLFWRASPAAAQGTVRECFGASLIRSAEGHALLGRQAPGQLHSGRVYPPSGLIDDEDVRGDTIDIDVSVARELGEETGLGPSSIARLPGYRLVLIGVQIAVIVEWRSLLPAAELRREILAYVDRQAAPELDEIVIVRNHADIDAGTMQPHACVLLRSIMPA
jgi:8-oxo-dGTP pyrophosphatase MutT (NUDIX family)